MFYSASACFLPDMVLTSYMPVPETNGEEWDRLKAATKENVEEGRLNVPRDVVSVLVALDAGACRGKLRDCMEPAIWGASQCAVCHRHGSGGDCFRTVAPLPGGP